MFWSDPLLAWSAPIETPLLFWIARIVCLAVTCVISWPSTPASSASFLIRPSRPRVMWIDAAGRGKRVDAIGVEHDERPLQIGTGAGLREHAADQR